MTFPNVCHHWCHPFPWLFAGTTVRCGPDGGLQDFRLPALAGAVPPAASLHSWDGLLQIPGFSAAVHAHQVHGAGVAIHGTRSAGRHTLNAIDGHLTQVPGLLLAVTIADCVPIFLVAPEPRGVALLHAGWRGVAAGMLEEGVARMEAALGTPPAQLRLHLGPAIAGSRYEVGAEVFDALGLPAPGERGLLDLRRHLVDRALHLGLLPEHIDVSPICTMEDPRFYSHRGGDSGRQVALLGILGESGGKA